ncbi:Mitochondrial Rho GTPase 1 [Clonorchis sinensis]|uniref:Mitochondrial Rho GTPase 1 n=1 Tax=Clonorchis sinensis TaxID=79923 RepID=A0A8T1MC15_CLOSI|nr:Mitochondrial Rho GTPase 1 [Clonorchis sinensis]
MDHAQGIRFRWKNRYRLVETESLINAISLFLAFGLLFVKVTSTMHGVDVPYWQKASYWSSCSTTCGQGAQRIKYQCVSQDMYGILTILEDQKCEGLNQPSEPGDERSCNLGSCSGYRWRVSNWGHCSQTCGGFGTMTRDVDCVYTGTDGDIMVNERDASTYCGYYAQPEKHSPCNRIACKPDFVPEQWGKCIQSDPCRPGRQVRQVLCISIQPNGTHLQLPRAACYRLGRPQQPTWRRCFIASTTGCEDQQPTIDTDHMTIVQMRKTRNLNLQVGQRAFVIPYTRVTVICPVHYFSVHEIVWTHPSHGQLKYTGRLDDRILVDRRGRLRIRSFRNEDAGEWECRAGNQSAQLNMHPRTPAEGFHDWIQRNRLWTRGMMSDDPKNMAVAHAIVQWVEGPWSACSVSCGDTGQQFRTVRCERVDTRYYEILDDQVCLDKLLPKPLSRRKCLKSKKCPGWVVIGADPSVCTDRCIAVDQGSIRGNITCRIGSQIVEEKLCDSSEKPDMSCPNPKCQVEWQVGPWSQCSKLCGGVGVRARQLTCTWVHDKQPAGPLCYANQLPSPPVIEECEAPPCKFECVDFLKYCPTRTELCKFTLYRYQCCATCRNFAFGLQSADKSNLVGRS